MPNAPFELAVERHIAAPPEVVFDLWAARLSEWWCPAPWTTELIELDLRAGGRFAVVMRGPAGEEEAVEGVILDVKTNERILFTDAFTAGWVPHAPFMVGFFEFAPEGSGTHYRAGARHWDAAAQEKHRAMGFAEGWTKVADQLAKLAEAGR